MEFPLVKSAFRNTSHEGCESQDHCDFANRRILAARATAMLWEVAKMGIGKTLIGTSMAGVLGSVVVLRLVLSSLTLPKRFSLTHLISNCSASLGS